MLKTYFHGLDVIGADPETNRAILIRVKDPAKVVRAQGTLATVAQSLAPATIEAKMYDEMAKQFSQKLKEQNVDADVTVVEPKGFLPADGKKHLWQDIAVGLGIVGALALAWGIVSSGSKVVAKKSNP